MSDLSLLTSLFLILNYDYCNLENYGILHENRKQSDKFCSNLHLRQIMRKSRINIILPNVLLSLFSKSNRERERGREGV